MSYRSIVLGLLAWLGCLPGGDLVALCLTLSLGAAAFGMRGLSNPAFGLLYHAYVAVLLHNGLSTVEFYSLPPGLWLLRAYRPAGLAVLLGPPLLLSLVSGEHALWTGTLAIGLLASGRPNLMAWGGLALLVALVFTVVIPNKEAVLGTSGLRFFILRWFHSLTWIALAGAAFFRAAGGSAAIAKQIAFAALPLYLIYLFTLITAK